MAATYHGHLEPHFVELHGLTQVGEVEFTKVFTGNSDREIYDEMDAMKAKIEAAGAQEIHRTKIGRNTPCPCGSGQKFKKCCIDKAA